MSFLKVPVWPWSPKKLRACTFLVRVCLQLEDENLVHLALTEFHTAMEDAAKVMNKELDVLMNQILVPSDLVDDFYGAIFPGCMAPVKRKFRELSQKFPEDAKFWFFVRLGKEFLFLFFKNKFPWIFFIQIYF